ncbi:uncharacterized protein BCR38DRAFT_451040 [Pseudomassariella vexata]|uniref:Calpain catalytic domain-containing protein n=1 Tax=Pseudomassariella vexata TaxID=1141098 RepID=A0A1Y2DAM1_9PEZI|nr:uncharacterized protein BCR38DRAFT_451040 [Pseudomassariella vexata]ORY56321.1 hypothetical protein BCR38DRAFT_451040 [Pseudomassariella vexata]
MSLIFPPPPSETAYLYRDDRTLDGGQTVNVELPIVLPNMPKKNKQRTPQQAIDDFWGKFTTKAPGKATTVIPHNEYVDRAAKRTSKAVGTTTQASYEEAAAVCKLKVAKIVKECKRVNQKYRDQHFDLEIDLKWDRRDTLESLCNVKDPSESKFRPKSVKRVADIFDKPQFYIDGPTANDVRQGRDGDCWLLAALCTLSNKPSLIERCCVARNEQVGVYGFVFHRDGEWISEVIDDKLFLTKPDFDDSFLERVLWEDRERVNSEEQYRKAYQSGSGALYFSQCEHTDETWLPLLEKAYAKAHADYAAIEGGFTGEGIEDLTGGVTSELYTTDILDKEYFWKEELMKVNDEFLFGCSTGMWGIGWGERKGIIELHAYSVMRAVEIDGHRLVLLKNPWGKGEWRGPWSDGSKEWTAEWLTKLDHRFGDDGNFWISYDDLLKKYQAFDRTRLFGPDWKVTSLWTNLTVPWTLDYHDTQFAFSICRTGPVVLVLSQLDDRYYRGLEGQYRFEINFRLHKAGREDYVVRSISPYCQNRSVNVELELEAGEYLVLLKINATRDMDILPIEEVIRNHARDRRDKLVAVGMSYDLAHSKGKVVETPEEKKARKDAEKHKKEREKRALKKKLMEARHRNHYLDVKDQQKRREKKAKAKAKAQLKKAEKAERAKAKVSREKAKKNSTSEAVRKDKEDGSTGSSKAVDPVKKHVQIQTPCQTPEPDLDDSKRESYLSADLSVKTPSTDSGKSCSETSATHSQPIHSSDEQPSSTKAEPSTVAIVAKQYQQPKDTKDDILSAVSPGETSPEEESSDNNTRKLSDFKTLVEKDSTDDKTFADKKADKNTAKDSSPADPCEEISDETDEETSDEETDISSVSDISDRELEIELDRRAAQSPMPPHQPQQMVVPEEEDEFERNPWNAVVTVGLRVYYKMMDADRDQEIVKLRVIRPNLYLKKDETSADKGNEDDDGDEQRLEEDDGDLDTQDKEGDGAKEGEMEKGLDVDDSSKDATLVGDHERRKKSIVPSNEGPGGT